MQQGKFTSLTKNKITTSLKNLGVKHSHKIICAVSGGGDSMAMLFLLQNFFKGQIIVCHYDHSTRNGESHLDAEFVKNYCLANSLPFFMEVLTEAETKEKGQSFEDFARQKRYKFFEKILECENCDFIATAHNKNDNAETQIFNFFRGGGIKALQGIPQKRDKIIRPVLYFTGGELRCILLQNDIPYVEDKTNKECLYTRNKIRNIALPWIVEHINQNVLDTLQNVAEISKEACEYITSVASADYDKIVNFDTENSQFVISHTNARQIPPIILKEIIMMLGRNLKAHPLEARRLNTLDQLIRSDKASWIFEWEEDITLTAGGEKIEIVQH